MLVSPSRASRQTTLDPTGSIIEGNMHFKVGFLRKSHRLRSMGIALAARARRPRRVKSASRHEIVRHVRLWAARQVNRRSSLSRAPTIAGFRCATQAGRKRHASGCTRLWSSFPNRQSK